MKEPSLAGRLASLQLVMAAVLIAAFAASTIWITAGALERQESTYLKNAAGQIAESLNHEWQEEGDLRRAAAAATEGDAPINVQYDVLDPTGRQIYSTSPTGPPPRGPHRSSLRVPLAHGGWVVASISTAPRQRAISTLLFVLALTGVPLFVAVVLIHRALVARAIRPLSRITDEAEAATRVGSIRTLQHPSDPAEVATLAGAFDRLFGRLDETLRAERNFTQDAAHELRTPITVLFGEVELALQDPALPERQREGLRRAGEQARALTELVEALLTLRRAEGLVECGRAEAMPVNIADLARDAIQESLNAVPARARDIQCTAGDEALVAGHATLLASAIRNLVSNGLKFTEVGQPVRVTVASGEDRCLVVVEDGGPGIPIGERERIFDPFFRGAEARSRQPGFGLGLPILRRVARAHGGDVAVSASALGGARFELLIPALRQDSPLASS